MLVICFSVFYLFSDGLNKDFKVVYDSFAIPDFHFNLVNKYIFNLVFIASVPTAVYSYWTAIVCRWCVFGWYL